MVYLLIDMGYLLFYRYHATKLWFKKAHDYKDDISMAETQAFQTTFKSRIESCIEKIIKQYKTDWSQVIFCRDSRRENIWRNQLYKPYKQNRDNSSLTGLKIAVNLLKLAIFRLIRYNNAKCIGLQGAEADDIVYCLVKRINKYESGHNIIIVTSDQDYYQLLNTNVTMVGLDTKDKTSKAIQNRDDISQDIKKIIVDKKLDYRQLNLLVKIIVGDKSDNLPSCFPKCGFKTAVKLAIDPNSLDNMFKKIPSSKDIFNLNKKMIDMSMIPKKLQDKINYKIDIALY